jgi:hypothetical protein
VDSRASFRRVLGAQGALLLLCALKLQAGVNRWTTEGPNLLSGWLLIDPLRPDVLYVANGGTFKSVDGEERF